LATVEQGDNQGASGSAFYHSNLTSTRHEDCTFQPSCEPGSPQEAHGQASSKVEPCAVHRLSTLTSNNTVNTPYGLLDLTSLDSGLVQRKLSILIQLRPDGVFETCDRSFPLRTNYTSNKLNKNTPSHDLLVGSKFQSILKQCHQPRPAQLVYNRPCRSRTAA